LISFSQGKVTQPVRQFVNITEHNGFFGLMPAVGQDMGIKLVTFYPDNGEKGLHTHHALILLFKAETGEPLAVLDGRLITEMRTAAVSAAATKALAKPACEVLAVLGAGLQARAHIEALSLVRDFKEIRIWARVPERAQALAGEVGAIAMGAEEAVRGADVVATTTAAVEPILRGEWLKAGAHVNAIGWNGPDGRELDDAAMRDNVVFVESREAAADQAGNVRGSGCEVYGEIGEALSGALPARAGETTIFDTVGMAIEDVATAALVYQRALAG
jgi:thiomorpholine-carboxylate dehydrogenase